MPERPTFIPGLDKFTGPACLRIRRRFGVTKDEVIGPAGVTRNGFDRWEAGHMRHAWERREAVYDALLVAAQRRTAEIAAQLQVMVEARNVRARARR